MEDRNSSYKGKRVIVTGASGFVGSHMCRRLVDLQAEVTAVVRESSNLWRLENVHDQVQLAKVNLADETRVSSLIAGVEPEYIFHFAIPPHAELNNEVDLQEQIDLTSVHLQNLFSACGQLNEQLIAFVHGCSGAVYEWTPENYILTENTPLIPATLRGRLKLSQRDLCMKLANEYGVNTKFARIFRAYGPYEVNTKLIVKALEAVQSGVPIPLGESTYKRDYIYIDDLIQGILMLGTSSLPTRTELNLGGEEQYSPEQVVAELERVLGTSVPKQLKAFPKNDYDRGDFIADCSLAKEKLGWKPNTSFSEGLAKTVEWYKAYTYESNA